MQITISHVRNALKAIAKDDLNRLSTSPLHDCAWILFCRWEGDSNDVATRALQLKTLLHWLINQLAPDPITATEKEKENRHILHRRYIEAKSVDETATIEQVAVPTVYTRTKRALQRGADLLNAASNEESLQAACYQVGAQLRYENASDRVQMLLQQLSITEVPVAPNELLHVSANTISEARRQRLVLGEAHIVLHPRLRAFVRARVSAQHQQRWSTHAAQIAVRKGALWQAHHNLFNSRQYSNSAELLIQHEPKLLQFATLNQLLNAIDAYEPQMLPLLKWTKLKLLAARFANRAVGQQVTLNYLHDVTSNDPAFQAYAELHRAIANRDSDRTLALQHFAQGLAQARLVTGTTRHTILTELYLRRTGVYLTDPIDLDSAEMDLATARELITTFNLSPYFRILMHNAAGRINTRKNLLDAAIACYEAGLVLARKINDIQLKISLIHNLGMIQTRRKQESLNYLLEGRALAESIGDQSSFAYYEKIIGGYYFHKEQYALSVQHNLSAYQRLSRLGNANAVANTCFDLAEALVQQGDFHRAKPYFIHARQYAEVHQMKSLDATCTKFAQQYPELIHPINGRQQLIINYLRKHGQMTKKAFGQQHPKMKPSSFHRDMSILIQLGVVGKVGEGRATTYRWASTQVK